MRLGIMGHRGLSPQVEAQVHTFLCELIDGIAAEELVGTRWVSDGPGAWFAQIVLAHGGRLGVVIPAVGYRESLPDRHRPVHDELTARAVEVHRAGLREPNARAHQAGTDIVVAWQTD
ncbi:hypothetical protein [Actinacidiphila acidipaludis]|uniref:Uncharacterized protein n=1 Tax=Actinacidiphila acidipaludis TaxID=2873382 RepID=A0ABS7PZV1_9ACTN|nr:hypothetical protein [Streptomyces acidipaludis]MBY8876181.1 hypothetical protein [Streptomyces acidipaludis]